MSTIDAPSPAANQPIWNTALRWGLWSGLTGVVISLLMYLLDYNPMSGGFSGFIIMMVVALIISAIFAALAIRQYRDQVNGGYVSYGLGLLIAIVTTTVGSFIGQVWEYILAKLIDPERMAKMGQAFADTWGQRMPPEALEEAMKKFEEGPQIMTIFTSGLIGGAIFGLIVGLVVAAIMKKEPPVA